MADLIFACSRAGGTAGAAERLRRAALRLTPPGVPPRDPVLIEAADAVAAIANPTEQGVFVHSSEAAPAGSGEGAACLGGLFEDHGCWWKTGEVAPEGTYALLRWTRDSVELLCDICASRTLWYAPTDEGFLASTSQRALVMLLGTFELLPEATACFLSSGTLGPEVSWDARLRRLPPDARLVLDRGSWRVTVTETPFELNAEPGDAGEAIARLRAAMAATCGSLDLDLGHWVLPLSGGHDSRALLALMVENGLRPRCVTWTTEKSLRNPLSDASLARRLARRFGVEHDLLHIRPSLVDLDTALTRFVAADEGRNDEIAGYLDGFALWRELASSGVQGIIRGDESFGPISRPMQPEAGRRQVGGAAPADYPDEHVLRRLDLAGQHWPPRLQRRAGENLLDYRLRLSQQGFIPIILAGLAEPKARYLEIVNPHLARRVIGTVRGLPPELRYQARAFRRITDALAPTIPYARSSSTPPAADLLRSQDLSELIVRELLSPTMERVLGPDGAAIVLTALSTAAGERPGPRARLRDAIRSASMALPTRLAVRLSPAWTGPEALPPVKLAFRALLAGRLITLLEEDARAVDRGDAVAVAGE